MSRKFVLALAGSILLAASFAGAQVSDDLGTASSIYCPNLTQTLSFGSRDATTWRPSLPAAAVPF